MQRRSTVRIKLITGDSLMTTNQIERLRKDAREMGHYLARLKKQGKQKQAYAIQKKQEYLHARIEDLEEEFIKVA